MEKKFQIKEPCNVGRENMKKISGGSFCNLCSKKVHDLSNKSNEEIKILLDSNESICGRIQASRLYQDETPKTKYNFFHFPFRKLASGIFVATIFSNSLIGQKIKDTLRQKEIIDGLIVYAPRDNEREEPFRKTVFRRVNGWIKNERGEKMPKAEVSLFSFNLLRTTTTNNQGNFNLQVTEDDAQKFSFIAVKDKDNSNKAFLFNIHKFDFDNIDLNLKNILPVEINPKKIMKIEEYYFDGEKISYNEFSDLITDDNSTYYYVPYPLSNQLLSDDRRQGIYIGFTKESVR